MSTPVATAGATGGRVGCALPVPTRPNGGRQGGIDSSGKDGRVAAVNSRSESWRRRRESNPCTRFCRPLPDHSGTSPRHAMAAPRGFEPRFTDPKSAVLPARRRGSRSAFEASRSTPVRQKKWSGRRDSNPRPSPWQGDALPTEPLPPAIRCARPSNGAEGQNRTDDTRLFRAVLYQLSYLGPPVRSVRCRPRPWSRIGFRR